MGAKIDPECNLFEGKSRAAGCGLMSNINSLSLGAGLLGIDVGSIQANAQATLEAALARKAAAKAVTTPWSSAGMRLAPSADDLVRQALAGKSAISNSSALTSTRNQDAQSLFALYNGLNSLTALATKAALKTTSDFDRSQLQNAFAKQLAESQAYVEKIDLQKVTLVKGAKLTKEDSTLVLARNASQYVTGVVQDGKFEDPVAALGGSVKFNITISRSTGASTIAIDLDDMGATPRTMSNIADFVTQKLKDAGSSATFAAVRVGTPNSAGRIEADTFGFKISTISFEKISFSADVSGPALVVAGSTGSGAAADGRITKLTNLSGGGTEEFVSTLNPEKGQVTWRQTVVGADGSYYAVGETTASLDGSPLKSEKDAVLAKYDSAGKLLWTKTLGAADDATGYSLAVSDDGKVAVAGSTTGKISADVKGGTDSFVTVFDAKGVEQWTRQSGTSQDDKAVGVAFDADGNVVIAGMTKGPLAGVSQGSWDGYLQTFTADGATVSKQQFGTSGEDSVAGVVVTDDGKVVVATTENGRGVLRKFDVAANASGVPEWTQDLGDMGLGGQLTSIAYENGAIYLGGRTASASFDAAQGGTAFGGMQDGFIARFDDGVGGPTKAWGTYTGGSGDDVVRGIAVSNGKVYATGETTAAMGGATQVGTQDVFMAQFNGTTGAQEFVSQASGGAGYAKGASIAVDPNGDSVLDLLGLPRGELNAPRSQELTARSNVRVGDSFYVSIGGGVKRKITIEKGDDWSDLAYKINSAISLNGRAAVRSTTSGTSLRVEAKGNAMIEFTSGPAGKDALGPLGLTVGTIYNDPALSSDTTSSSAPRVIALGLDQTWSLADKTAAASVRDTLDQVLRRVRNAYDAATGETDATTKKPGKTGGAVPAFLSAQLSNYSAALYRLQSGGSSTSSAASLLTG